MSKAVSGLVTNPIKATAKVLSDPTSKTAWMGLAKNATDVDPTGLVPDSVRPVLEKAAPIALSFIPGVGPLVSAAYSAADSFGNKGQLGTALLEGASSYASGTGSLGSLGAGALGAGASLAGGGSAKDAALAGALGAGSSYLHSGGLSDGNSIFSSPASTESTYVPEVDPSLPWASTSSAGYFPTDGMSSGGAADGASTGIGGTLKNLGSDFIGGIQSLANNLGLSTDTMSNLFSSSATGGGNALESFNGTGALPEVASASLGAPTNAASIFSSAPVDSSGFLSSFDDETLKSLSSLGDVAPAAGNIAGGAATGLTQSPNIGAMLQEATGAPSPTSSFYSPATSVLTGGSPTDSLSSAAKAASPGILDQLKTNPLGTIGKTIMDHPMAALGAAGLGLSALKGNTPVKGETAFNEIASGQAQQGKALQDMAQQAITSGQLPPGLSASINQATEAAKATIRSQYAARGMSGSSSEQQDLAAVDARAQAQGSAMALQLLQTGINETGMASGLYQQIMGQNMQKDQELSSALAQFAASLAGGSGRKSGE